MIELLVEVDKKRGEFVEGAEIDGGVVDKCPGLSAGANFAADDSLGFIVELFFLKGFME